MNAEDQIIKNTYEDIREEVREVKKLCGNLKGDRAVKCFTEANEFEDDIIDVFSDSVSY